MFSFLKNLNTTNMIHDKNKKIKKIHNVKYFYFKYKIFVADCKHFATRFLFKLCDKSSNFQHHNMPEDVSRYLPAFAKPTPESTGLLEKPNGFSTYAALAQHFDKSTQEYYGTPMVAFVEAFIKETDQVRKYFDAALRDSKEKHLPKHAGGQDDRVFKFFFTIGFAGELATRYGIIPFLIIKYPSSYFCIFEQLSNFAVN
jgi:hypothetical protein